MQATQWFEYRPSATPRREKSNPKFVKTSTPYAKAQAKASSSTLSGTKPLRKKRSAVAPADSTSSVSFSTGSTKMESSTYTPSQATLDYQELCNSLSAFPTPVAAPFFHYSLGSETDVTYPVDTSDLFDSFYSPVSDYGSASSPEWNTPMTSPSYSSCSDMDNYFDFTPHSLPTYQALPFSSPSPPFYSSPPQLQYYQQPEPSRRHSSQPTPSMRMEVSRRQMSLDITSRQSETDRMFDELMRS